MSEFELLVIPLSVILALGVTRILSGLVHALRYRERARLHWLPITWGAYILMYSTIYFNTIWAINQQNPAWTWRVFAMPLVYSVLIFVSAGLIISSDELAVEAGMLEDFEKRGRLALLPFALSFAISIPFNKWGGGPDWLSLTNALNVVLVLLALAVFRAKRATTMTIATIAFGLVSSIGWFFVFAQPGDG